jgi:hypothetical protein
VSDRPAARDPPRADGRRTRGHDSSTRSSSSGRRCLLRAGVRLRSASRSRSASLSAASAASIASGAEARSPPVPSGGVENPVPIRRLRSRRAASVLELRRFRRRCRVAPRSPAVVRRRGPPPTRRTSSHEATMAATAATARRRSSVRDRFGRGGWRRREDGRLARDRTRGSWAFDWGAAPCAHAQCASRRVHRSVVSEREVDVLQPAQPKRNRAAFDQHRTTPCPPRARTTLSSRTFCDATALGESRTSTRVERAGASSMALSQRAPAAMSS